MKLLIAVIALVSFGIFVPNMYGDDLTLNLGAIGLGSVDLGPVQAGAGVVTYDVNNLSLLGLPNVIAGDVNFNFTAAFVDAGATLPGSATWPVGATDALVVTESCIGAEVTLGGTFNPCSGLAYVYTNDNVGNIVGITGGLNIGADVNADVGPLDASLDIGQNYYQTTGFAPTPEPGTLSLMGTGLLGIAGVVRRKFRS